MILKNLTPAQLANHLEEVASDLRAETVTLYDAIRRLADDFAGWEEELDDEEEDWEGEEDDDMRKIDAALAPPEDPIADAAADTAGEIVDHLRAAGKLADRLPADWQERWSDCFADALNRAKGMLYPHYLES